MSRRTTILGICLLLGLLIAVQFFRRDAPPRLFAPMTFEQAQAAAAESSPPRLLFIWFAAAGDDQDFGQSALWADPALAQWVARHAVAIRIDAEHDKSRLRTFGVQTVPAAVLLDGTRVLARVEGQQPPKAVLDTLRSAAEAARAAPPAPPPSPPPDTPTPVKPADPPGAASGPGSTPSPPR